MAARIAQTSCPWIGIPSPVKSLLDRFVTILDGNTLDAGWDLANTIFTPTGIFFTLGRTFNGYGEILYCRRHTWDAVASIHHEIRDVFVAREDSSDLLMIGYARLELKNGKFIEGEYVAKAVIDGVQTSQPRLAQLQVWGVGTSLGGQASTHL